jgi:hypothetical protein
MTAMNIKGGIPWQLGDLFHLSFKGNLAGEWTPMSAAEPEGPEEDTGDQEPWPYPDLPWRRFRVLRPLKGVSSGFTPMSTSCLVGTDIRGCISLCTDPS